MKRLMIVVLALLMAVSFLGCSLDSLGEYKKAVEKTDQIKKGQTAGEFSVIMDFNTEGMTEEQIKELNYFKDMKGSFSVAYDDDAEQGIIRNYMSLGGLGFDMDMYINGDEVFMKLPILGKYMRIDETQPPLDMEQLENEGVMLLTQETQDKLSEVWIGLLRKEDVFKGKDIVLTTPDGEVKTKEYTIRLNDAQIKSLAKDALEILSKDEKLKRNYEDNFKKYIKYLKDTSFEKLLSDVGENIEKYTVEGFNYTAYVDIDGYLVNEMIEVELKIKDVKPASMSGIRYSLDIKSWDINKEQKFEFPVLTEDNTLDMNEVDKSMPPLMKDLFDNKD